MIKFDKKWVKCFWEDELEGKEVFIADNIADLHLCVETGDTNIPSYGECHKNEDPEDMEDAPFRIDESSVCWRFCYYDPYYKYRVALEQGQCVEARYEDETVDVTQDTLAAHDVSRLWILDKDEKEKEDIAEGKVLPQVGTVWQHVTKPVTALVTALHKDQTYPILICDDWCSAENFYKNWSQVYE